MSHAEVLMRPRTKARPRSRKIAVVVWSLIAVMVYEGNGGCSACDDFAGRPATSTRTR
jgi:hypothetical protein